MNTWKVVLATLVIFVTGVVTGGLLVSYADRAAQTNRPLRQRAEGRLPGNNQNLPAAVNAREPQSSRLPNPIQNRMPRGVSLEFLQRLDAEVHLTAGQREHIQQVIADGQLRNKAIIERITPEVRRELAETQRHIRELLTPEQRTRFEEVMKQSRPRDQRRPTTPRDQTENSQPVPPTSP